MIKTADRYIGRAAILGTLVVWMGLTTLMMIFTLLDGLGSDVEGLGLTGTLWYVLLSMPRAAYTVFSVSALLGALIGIGGLAAANELVALRTAGVSRLRISASVMGAIGLLTLAVVVLGEWVMPVAESQARSLKHVNSSKGNIVGGEQGMWIRDGGQFVHIRRPVVAPEEGSNEVQYHDVVIYSFDDSGGLEGVVRAREADHEEDSWTLRNVNNKFITGEGIEQRFRREQTWESSIKPELLESAVTRPKYMSIRDILAQLEYLNQNGLDKRAYESAFWTKLLFPFSVMALVLAGMPFVFGSARNQSTGLRLFIGMTLGSVFLIVSKAMQNFSDAYELPALFGAAVPSVALAVVVVVILKRSV